MPDRFTETATTGYGSRIGSSVKGVVIGIILFLASFGLLYWNEGRVDLSNIAKTATEISSETPNTDPSLNGKLVSVSGVVNSDQIIGDNLFLKPARFIAVERKAEMYAWVEKTETKSKTNVGGSETTDKTYTYNKEWTESPAPSNNFGHPEGHENPQKTIDSYENKVTAASIGVYHFDPQSAILPNFSKLPLNSENVIVSKDVLLANDTYLFMSKSEGGTFESSHIGDMRISYNVLSPNFDGTIFGTLSGNKIDPFLDQKGSRLYHVFSGTRDEGIAALSSEYTTMLWLLRLAGFLMMWFGLSMLFGPISVLLDILPIFGAISRSLVGGITFIVSLILTIVTIIVSAIAHNLLALIIALAITISAIIFFFVLLKKKRAAT